MKILETQITSYGLYGEVYDNGNPEELDYVIYKKAMQGNKEKTINLGSGKLFIVSGTKEIDCFNGNFSRDNVIKPLLKKLEKLGYTTSF